MWEHHQNAAKIHPRLVFACEGGGGVGSVERGNAGVVQDAVTVSSRALQVSDTMGLP